MRFLHFSINAIKNLLLYQRFVFILFSIVFFARILFLLLYFNAEISEESDIGQDYMENEGYSIQQDLEEVSKSQGMAIYPSLTSIMYFLLRLWWRQ